MKFALSVILTSLLLVGCQSSENMALATSQAKAPDYVEAVCGQGGLPMLIPLGLQMDELRDLYDRTDGLLLSGGGDIHPEQYGDTLTELCKRIDAERDELEFALVRWAAAE